MGTEQVHDSVDGDNERLVTETDILTARYAERQKILLAKLKSRKCERENFAKMLTKSA